MTEYAVLVVGAGQARLPAAYALARVGLDPEQYAVLDYPGRAVFRGRQLHTHDYRSAEELGNLSS